MINSKMLNLIYFNVVSFLPPSRIKCEGLQDTGGGAICCCFKQLLSASDVHTLTHTQT